jgi:hypothetical protein
MAEVAPESNKGSFKLLGFDGQGGLQLIGGLVIGLIALYSSYDHVNFFRSTIHLNQQWGVWPILAPLAVLVIVAAGFCAAVAQLASRSRLGEENRRIQDERTAAEAAERIPGPVSRTSLIGSAGAGVMGLYPGAGMDRGSRCSTG